MNDSWGLFGAGMETSHLLSIYQHAGVPGGDRVSYVNNAALGVLLGGVCISGAGFFITVFVFCYKRISVQSLTVFTASLILTNLMQFLSTPVLAMELLGSICRLRYCYKLLIVWFVSTRCGMLLHLFVVLEYILNSQSSKGTTTVPLFLSVPIVLTLNLMCVLFFDVVEAAVGLGTVAIVLILFVFRTGCRSVVPTKHLSKVLFIAFLSYSATYCPSFVMDCMILNEDIVSGRLYDIFLCLTNLRLITDVCLFGFICKKTPQNAPPEIEIGHVNPDFVIQNQHFE